MNERISATKIMTSILSIITILFAAGTASCRPSAVTLAEVDREWTIPEATRSAIYRKGIGVLLPEKYYYSTATIGGRQWFLTRSGIFQLDEAGQLGRWINPIDGLSAFSSDAVEDGSRVWLSSRYGLSCLEIASGKITRVGEKIFQGYLGDPHDVTVFDSFVVFRTNAGVWRIEKHSHSIIRLSPANRTFEELVVATDAVWARDAKDHHLTRISLGGPQWIRHDIIDLKAEDLPATFSGHPLHDLCWRDGTFHPSDQEVYRFDVSTRRFSKSNRESRGQVRSRPGSATDFNERQTSFDNWWHRQGLPSVSGKDAVVSPSGVFWEVVNEYTRSVFVQTVVRSLDLDSWTVREYVVPRSLIAKAGAAPRAPKLAAAMTFLVAGHCVFDTETKQWFGSPLHLNTKEILGAVGVASQGLAFLYAQLDEGDSEEGPAYRFVRAAGYGPSPSTPALWSTDDPAEVQSILAVSQLVFDIRREEMSSGGMSGQSVVNYGQWESRMTGRERDLVGGAKIFPYVGGHGYRDGVPYMIGEDTRRRWFTTGQSYAVFALER